jgi:cytoskeletal protein RodZ
MFFKQRPLAAPSTVGERLHQLREETRLDLADLAPQLKIPAKYLEAIEESRYQDLPGLVYARNFVRLYASRMSLNLTTVMEKFEEEYAIMAKTRGIARPLMVQRAKTEAPWYRRHGRLLIAGAVIMIVLAYFGWQIWNLFTPPNLVIVRPATDVTTTESAITVSGISEGDAKVSINNAPIQINDRGEFSESIDLQRGLNTLKITAKKKYSRERVVYRNILVEPTN